MACDNQRITALVQDHLDQMAQWLREGDARAWAAHCLVPLAVYDRDDILVIKRRSDLVALVETASQQVASQRAFAIENSLLECENLGKGRVTALVRWRLTRGASEAAMEDMKLYMFRVDADEGIVRMEMMENLSDAPNDIKDLLRRRLAELTALQRTKRVERG